jgi:hypothetical protein
LGVRPDLRCVRQLGSGHGRLLPQRHVGAGGGSLPTLRCSAVHSCRGGSDASQRLRPRRGARVGVGVVQSRCRLASLRDGNRAERA